MFNKRKIKELEDRVFALEESIRTLKQRFKVGDVVKHKVFDWDKGIVICDVWNGCFDVQYQDKNGKIRDACFDQDQLEHVK